jgi:hypothetical protein
LLIALTQKIKTSHFPETAAAQMQDRGEIAP